MDATRSHGRYVVLLLPLVAAGLLASELTRGGGFFPRKPSVRPGAAAYETGPAAPISYWYRMGGSMSAPARFTRDAPLVHDGVVGDQSSGYSFGNAGLPSASSHLYVMIDLGAPRVISRWEYACRFQGGHDNTACLYASDSATSRAWVPRDRAVLRSNGPDAGARQIAPATYRYWMICYETIGPRASVTATDARLYEVNRREPVKPPAPARSRQHLCTSEGRTVS